MTLEVCCGPLSSVSAQTKASTRSGEYPPCPGEILSEASARHAQPSVPIACGRRLTGAGFGAPATVGERCGKGGCDGQHGCCFQFGRGTGQAGSAGGVGSCSLPDAEVDPRSIASSARASVLR